MTGPHKNHIPSRWAPESFCQLPHSLPALATLQTFSFQFGRNGVPLGKMLADAPDRIGARTKEMIE